MNTIIGNQAKFDAVLSKLSEGPIPRLVCPKDVGAYYYGSKKMGQGEKQLRPTKDHLIRLARHLAGCQKSSDVLERQCLFGLHGVDKQEIALARAEYMIERIYTDERTTVPRAWYVFEGNTCPDFYIEGDNYIILGEGKWREGNITLTTSFLNNGEQRCQMVRHIQAALNATDKTVYAFYIVDDNCSYKEDLTKKALAEQLGKESIPLSELDQKKILNAFYGYTTWQAIEELGIGVSFLSVDQIK